MACTCCLLTDVFFWEGPATIVENVISLNVDTTIDALRDFKSDADCIQDPNNELAFFGPSKGSLQISSYPFRQGDDYNFNFNCPVNVHVQFPFRYIYDCSVCGPCYNPVTGVLGRKRGTWKGIPNSKKTITVEGELGPSLPIQVGGCEIPSVKFAIQAGPTPVVSPPKTVQYSWIVYNGIPLPFDSRNTLVYEFSINFGSACPGAFPFDNIKAYLTSFSWVFNPPKPPVANYGFDIILPICPPDCG